MKKVRVIEEKRIAVVTATSDFNPLNNFKTLGEELAAMKFEGSVVLDLLARNGLASNRFLVIPFDGSKFDRSLLAVLTDLDIDLKKEQDSAIRQNSQFVSSTVLASQEIKEFLAG